VWGWIKRWFDPVTVNKIFILSHHEVKARLSEFIDPDDFPKKYGGNLDWEFGMTPHLDQAAREAVEKNGSQDWIEGPCLWEQNQRVPVGTVGGKPRRPANLVPVPAPAVTDSNVSQLPPTTTEPAASVQAATLSPTTAQSQILEPTKPPSMTHSGSTASTIINTPPEAMTVAPTADGTAKVLKSEAPIVANGEVLQGGDVKPPMERFVTAAEDLSTVRTQAQSVA
jgi:CRAL/TRIO domain